MQKKLLLGISLEKEIDLKYITPFKIQTLVYRYCNIFKNLHCLISLPSFPHKKGEKNISKINHKYTDAGDPKLGPKGHSRGPGVMDACNFCSYYNMSCNSLVIW